MVAVWMVTYNHGEFIENAIESVMMQKSTFQYKLFIGEDNSTDKTREICKKLKEKYPDKIELFLHKKNIGSNSNGVFMYKECFKSEAKYIALLEGDDYWTDPYKLQKQVDFLEANPDYVLSFHKVKILKPSGELVSDFITNVPENYETIETLARLGNYIHTPSVVFRNCIKDFPPEFAYTPIGDYFIYMLLAEHGKLNYIEEEMTVYRYGVGILSGNDGTLKLKKWIDCLILIFSNCKNQVIKSIVYERYQMAIQEMYRMTLKKKEISNFSKFKNKLRRLINKFIRENS